MRLLVITHWMDYYPWGRFSSLQIWMLFHGASITYSCSKEGSSLVNESRILVQESSEAPVFYLCGRSHIVSPYPAFSVQLLELHTGVVSGIHTTSYQRWWLEQAQSVATTIIQTGRLQTVWCFTPPALYNYFHTSILPHTLHDATYFACNVNWLTHAWLTVPDRCIKDWISTRTGMWYPITPTRPHPLTPPKAIPTIPSLCSHLQSMPTISARVNNYQGQLFTTLNRFLGQRVINLLWVSQNSETLSPEM